MPRGMSCDCSVDGAKSGAAPERRSPIGENNWRGGPSRRWEHHTMGPPWAPVPCLGRQTRAGGIKSGALACCCRCERSCSRAGWSRSCAKGFCRADEVRPLAGMSLIKRRNARRLDQTEGALESSCHCLGRNTAGPRFYGGGMLPLARWRCPVDGAGTWRKIGASIRPCGRCTVSGQPL